MLEAGAQSAWGSGRQTGPGEGRGFDTKKLTCFSGPPLRQRFSQRAGLRLEEARLSESPGRAAVKKTSEDFEWPHPRGCPQLRVTCRHQGPTVRPDPGDSCQPQSGKRGRGLSLRHRAGGQMPASLGLRRPILGFGVMVPSPTLCFPSVPAAQPTPQRPPITT